MLFSGSGLFLFCRFDEIMAAQHRIGSSSIFFHQTFLILALIFVIFVLRVHDALKQQRIWRWNMASLLHLANRPFLNFRILNIFEKIWNNMEATTWKVKTVEVFNLNIDEVELRICCHKSVIKNEEPNIYMIEQSGIRFIHHRRRINEKRQVWILSRLNIVDVSCLKINY